MAYRIAVVVGSLRRESFNRALAHAAISLGPDDFSFEFVEIGDLPLYNQDYDADLPDAVRRFKQAVEASDALLFVTPEYNRSIPGVLKNAIDWGSRPHAMNSWGQKPGGMLGTSPGALGTALAQANLRVVLASLDVALLPAPELYIKHDAARIDDQWQILNDDTRKVLQNFVDHYAAWVRKYAPAKAA